MRYRALLLDFYGTLVAEDDAVISSICARVASSLPFPESSRRFAARWYELFSQTCRDSFADSFRTQREIEVESLGAAMAEYSASGDPRQLSQELYDYWQRPAAFPESSAFLSSCPVPICIVSNIDTGDILAAAGIHGWRFSLLVTSECVRSYKPRPEIFLAALSRLNLDAASVLHVGDSLSSDIAGAQAVGIDSAWVNRAGRKLPKGHPVPTHECENLVDLLTVMKRAG